MADMKREQKESFRGARELRCIGCGERFLFRSAEQERAENMGWHSPKRCPTCRKDAREQRRLAAEQIEREAWKQTRDEERKQFEAMLTSWPVIPLDEIRAEDDRVLYIIGNGFDLMHGVRSSYYAFRDSLGKRSLLRETLEAYLTPADIWADFESALAQFNLSAMGSQFMVDNWLDWMDAYGESASAAQIEMAIEAAASPIQIVVQELNCRFRMWVESLSIGTKDRPLKALVKNGKVLCFNYTEFVETLYEIPQENVCYIHGCRRKRRDRPEEPLILGHLPGASESAFAFDDDSHLRINDPFKRAMSRVVKEQVLQRIADYDEDLTKDSREIIAAHAPFFAALSEIERVVVVGHSFSPVDWDYFAQVAANCSGGEPVRWYFGCHGLRDLKNLEQLLAKLNVDREAVSIFRTNTIHVTPVAGNQADRPAANLPKEKTRCTSPDRRWTVKTAGARLAIVDREKQTENYALHFPTGISQAFFLPAGDSLIVLIRGVEPGVFLFRLENGRWSFVSELESSLHQSLLNNRLRNVYVTERELTFVYRNRVRKYALFSGRLCSNQALRHADQLAYEGEDIGAQLLPRR